MMPVDVRFELLGKGVEEISFLPQSGGSRHAQRWKDVDEHSQSEAVSQSPSGGVNANGAVAPCKG